MCRTVCLSIWITNRIYYMPPITPVSVKRTNGFFSGPYPIGIIRKIYAGISHVVFSITEYFIIFNPHERIWSSHIILNIINHKVVIFKISILSCPIASIKSSQELLSHNPKTSTLFKIISDTFFPAGNISLIMITLSPYHYIVITHQINCWVWT